MPHNAFDGSDISPHAEGRVANGSICVGGEVMAMKPKETMDAAVGRQKALCMAAWLESLHLPFSSSRRLV